MRERHQLRNARCAPVGVRAPFVPESHHVSVSRLCFRQMAFPHQARHEILPPHGREYGLPGVVASAGQYILLDAVLVIREPIVCSYGCGEDGLRERADKPIGYAVAETLILPVILSLPDVPLRRLWASCSGAPIRCPSLFHGLGSTHFVTRLALWVTTLVVSRGPATAAIPLLLLTHRRETGRSSESCESDIFTEPRTLAGLFSSESITPFSSVQQKRTLPCCRQTDFEAREERGQVEG